jgi:hypothetical protein
MCYRLPIKANIAGYEIEIEEHIDLCLPCIEKAFCSIRAESELERKKVKP